jgi:HK97 gp10 family phage protein
MAIRDHFVQKEAKRSMAPTFTLQATGLKDLRRDLRAAEATLPRELRKALNEVGKIIVTDARPNIPVLSRALAGTIRVRSTQTAGQVVLGTGRTPYAQAIYWGTGPRRGRRGPHNISPHPVMHEALERQKIPVIVALRAVVERFATILEGR